MKAFSLWQPWATGIALGVKRLETRHWAPAYRGILAIHAAKRWEVEQRAFAEQERAAGTIGFGLPFGGIVAVCRLIDVKRTEQVIVDLDAVEARWGNYEPRRYAWVLDDVRPLPTFVPCAGRQSLWTLADDVAAAVRAAIGGEL